MRDDFGDLTRLDAAIERTRHVVRHVDRLIAGDEDRERNDAAIAWRKARSFPYVAEKTTLRVLLEGRRDHPDIVKRQHWLRSCNGLCLLRSEEHTSELQS